MLLEEFSVKSGLKQRVAFAIQTNVGIQVQEQTPTFFFTKRRRMLLFGYADDLNLVETEKLSIVPDVIKKMRLVRRWEFRRMRKKANCVVVGRTKHITDDNIENFFFFNRGRGVI